MKVLLVYPEFPDTFWSFKHALPFQGKRSAFPPLGLLTISAHAAQALAEAPGGFERPAPEGFGPGLGRRGVLQRHDCARPLDAGADCARQTARQANGGGRADHQRS